jgi:hypothetical protein
MKGVHIIGFRLSTHYSPSFFYLIDLFLDSLLGNEIVCYFFYFFILLLNC